MIEYRLTWEMPADVHLVTRIQETHGRGVWPTYDWDTLGEWTTIEVVFTGDARMGQYNTLRNWAATREQPIRNVKLEKRTAPEPTEGWQPASGERPT